MLNRNLRMRDLSLSTNSATRLHLKGYTLYLTAPYHNDWGDESHVVYNEGRIVWPSRGSLILIR